MADEEKIVSDIIDKTKEMAAILLIMVLGYGIGTRVLPEWAYSVRVAAILLSVLGFLKCVDVTILGFKLSKVEK